MSSLSFINFCCVAPLYNLLLLNIDPKVQVSDTTGVQYLFKSW